MATDQFQTQVAATRDYIDVAAALTTRTRDQLMAAAFSRDPGLRVADFATAAALLDQIDDHRFTRYGLDGPAVAALRAAYPTWPRDPIDDPARHAGQGGAHSSAGPDPDFPYPFLVWSWDEHHCTDPGAPRGRRAQPATGAGRGCARVR